MNDLDRAIIYALAEVTKASGMFSFGILTDTLPVMEQLDFGYKLIHLAGLIRTRVELAPPPVNGTEQ